MKFALLVIAAILFTFTQVQAQEQTLPVMVVSCPSETYETYSLNFVGDKLVIRTIYGEGYTRTTVVKNENCSITTKTYSRQME